MPQCSSTLAEVALQLRGYISLPPLEGGTRIKADTRYAPANKMGYARGSFVFMHCFALQQNQSVHKRGDTVTVPTGQ